jgi:hypothetical protein
VTCLWYAGVLAAAGLVLKREPESWPAFAVYLLAYLVLLAVKFCFPSVMDHRCYM